MMTSLIKSSYLCKGEFIWREDPNQMLLKEFPAGKQLPIEAFLQAQQTEANWTIWSTWTGSISGWQCNLLASSMWYLFYCMRVAKSKGVKVANSYWDKAMCGRSEKPLWEAMKVKLMLQWRRQRCQDLKTSIKDNSRHEVKRAQERDNMCFR